MATVGFLHTAAVHVPTFSALLQTARPGARDTHVVDESLLADARTRGGVDAELERGIEARLRELVAQGAHVIVCTCSTIGGHAERLTTTVGTPVLRIDRPMAEEAVATGGRVAVVAALASTAGPTRALLQECAAAAGTAPELVDAPCPQAWALFEAGDQQGYLALLAEHVRELAAGVDVVVLAQASMAGAADLLADLPIPVRSSPRAAVSAAVARLA